MENTQILLALRFKDLPEAAAEYAPDPRSRPRLRLNGGPDPALAVRAEHLDGATLEHGGGLLDHDHLEWFVQNEVRLCSKNCKI